MVTTSPLEPPALLPNLVDGDDVVPAGATLARTSPHDGRALWQLPCSSADDVADLVGVARDRAAAWAATAAPARGEALRRLADTIEAHADALASIVARETGKSPKDARGEVAGAVTLGRFFAGEGLRLFGRTTTSAVASKHAMTVREPIGVAALIGAANTPIANIAWKVFPALVCGNTAVVKAPENAPATAWAFGELTRRAGLPPGVVGVLQGLGHEAGRALVADPRVDVVSFTGSTAAGREIGRVAAERLARVSLELGGKNPFVVCDDADLEHALDWVVPSAFSNAGQRCASGSRIIVTEGIHDRFVAALLERTARLEVGPTDDDDLGPVITVAARDRIVAAVRAAVDDGLELLAGGHALDDPAHAAGAYLAPTVIGMTDPSHPLTTHELFGPVAQVYRVPDYPAALALANDSPYGLTACIHTRDLDRALHFARHVSAGVAVVNGGTFGSEPHMPFGGRRHSGNGTREPGPEALDVYSSLKTVYLWVDEARVR